MLLADCTFVYTEVFATIGRKQIHSLIKQVSLELLHSLWDALWLWFDASPTLSLKVLCHPIEVSEAQPYSHWCPFYLMLGIRTCSFIPELHPGPNMVFRPQYTTSAFPDMGFSKEKALKRSPEMQGTHTLVLTGL